MSSVKIIVLFFSVGFLFGIETRSQDANKTNPPRKVLVDPKSQSLDFTGLSLEGELKAPGEFYFQNRNQERFDDLTKRRVNFHRELLRDSVQSQ